jgi:hypothetical protein
MPDNEQKPRQPDNSVTIFLDGTTYIVNEFFSDKDTLNDIVLRRILQDTEPEIGGV